MYRVTLKIAHFVSTIKIIIMIQNITRVCFQIHTKYTIFNQKQPNICCCLSIITTEYIYIYIHQFEMWVCHTLLKLGAIGDDTKVHIQEKERPTTRHKVPVRLYRIRLKVVHFRTQLHLHVSPVAYRNVYIYICIMDVWLVTHMYNCCQRCVCILIAYVISTRTHICIYYMGVRVYTISISIIYSLR